MNEDTRAALEQSIAHWRKNATAAFENAAVTGMACALCLRFCGAGRSCIRRDDDGQERCPVFERTGVPHCGESPWVEAYSAYCNWSDAYRNGSERTEAAQEEFQAAARKEVEFLESLL